MIEDGALDNVQAIFGLHSNSLLSLGQVESRPGRLAAGSGIFEAEIRGKGGHAAIPQQTIDPILAASNVIVSLQQLVSRESDPLDSLVLQSLHICVCVDFLASFICRVNFSVNTAYLFVFCASSFLLRKLKLVEFPVLLETETCG